MKTILIIIITFATFPNLYSAQKNFSNWVFGDGAWIKFPDDTSAPYFVERSKIDQVEGCAAYSDDNRNLLFYTDGVTVWNNKHQIIKNGTGLMGSWTSFQGAYFIPIPGEKDKLYVISIGATDYPDDNIHYSILDYSKGYDEAEITVKNVEFNNNYDGERVAVVKKEGQSGYWLILDDVAKPNYLVYSVDENGIKLKAKYTGNLNKKDNHGAIKISPNSNLLVSVDSDKSEFEISRFNNFTGEIYDSRRIFNSKLGTTVFGPAFSPNSQYLYITANKRENGQFVTILNQFDIMEFYKTGNVVLNTIVWENFVWKIGSKESPQLAPNGKIYIASPETNYLSSIEYPNKKYPDCNYIEKSVDLKNSLSKNGLPSAVVYPEITYTYKDTTICGDNVFSYIPEASDVSYWITPNKGTVERKELNLPEISSVDTGYYHAYSKENELREILRVQIVNYRPISIISNNSNYQCEGDTVTLFINEKTANPVWSTGETSDTIKVTEPGVYYVTVFGNTICSSKDSVEVSFLPSPKAEIIGQHQIISCRETEIELYSKFANSTYKWLDSLGNVLSYKNSLKVSATGKFRLIVSNEFGCADTSDFYDVEFIDRDSNVLSISYSIADIVRFDTLQLNEMRCLSIKIKNTSGEPFILNGVKLRDKYYFSAIPSQFPLTLEPFQEIELEVCFKGDSIGNFEDIMEIADNCGPKYVRLEAVIGNKKLKGISKCDVPWSFTPISLVGDYTFRTSLPFPNPTKGKISVDYIEFRDSKETSSTISLYDSRGAYVTDLEREITDLDYYENGILEKGQFNLTRELRNGVYFIRIQSSDEIRFEPIIIHK